MSRSRPRNAEASYGVKKKTSFACSLREESRRLLLLLPLPLPLPPPLLLLPLLLLLLHDITTPS